MNGREWEHMGNDHWSIAPHNVYPLPRRRPLGHDRRAATRRSGALCARHAAGRSCGRPALRRRCQPLRQPARARRHRSPHGPRRATRTGSCSACRPRASRRRGHDTSRASSATRILPRGLLPGDRAPRRRARSCTRAVPGARARRRSQPTAPRAAAGRGQRVRLPRAPRVHRRGVPPLRGRAGTSGWTTTHP